MSCFVSLMPSGGSNNECYLPVAITVTSGSSQVLHMQDLKKDDLIMTYGRMTEYDTENIQVVQQYHRAASTSLYWEGAAGPPVVLTV